MKGSFFKSAAVGLCASLCCLLLLLLICAFVSGKSADPDKLIAPLAFCTLAVSALAGGAVSSRVWDGGFAASVVCGAMLSVVHLIAHITSGAELNMLKLIAVYAGIIAFAFAGGLIFRKRSSSSASKKLRKLRKYSKNSKYQ